MWGPHPCGGCPFAVPPTFPGGGGGTNPQDLLASGIQPFLQAVSSGNKIGKPRHSTKLGYAK